MLLLRLDALTRNVEGMPPLMFGEYYNDIVMLALGCYDGQHNPDSDGFILAALARFNRHLKIDHLARVGGIREHKGAGGLLAMLESADSGIAMSAFEGAVYVNYTYGHTLVGPRHKTPVYPQAIISFGMPYNQRLQGNAHANNSHFAAWRVGMEWRV